jgi:hypothetical protein
MDSQVPTPIGADELTDEPISPELVLVSPPEYRRRVLERLPVALEGSPRAEPRSPPPPEPHQADARREPAATGRASTYVALMGSCLLVFTLSLKDAPAYPLTSETPSAALAAPGASTTPGLNPQVQLEAHAVSTTGAPVPLLDWPPAAGATYYDVQVYRNGTKIFEAWPLQPGVALPTYWRYAGQDYRLEPGRYSWFVWVGEGQKSVGRYRKGFQEHILQVK